MRIRIWTLSFIAIATGLALPDGTKGEELPPLFPFVISYDGPDNASSMAHLLDAPAGKNDRNHLKARSMSGSTEPWPSVFTEASLTRGP